MNGSAIPITKVLASKIFDDGPLKITEIDVDHIKENTSAHGITADNDISSVVNKAPLANPTFTGVPAAPTAAAGTNTTQIATTAYVKNEPILKTGYYAGNDEVNRAIAHGLGKVPSSVLLISVRTVAFVWILINSTTWRASPKATYGGTGSLTVTEATTTNFYVGEAGGTCTANDSGADYVWIAFR